MSVSDLTNTKWLLNNSIVTHNNNTFNINFSSNNASYTSLSWSYLADDDFYSLYYNSTNTYYYMGTGTWLNDNYKTITITGGSDVTNATLISWLEANATQQASPLSNSIYIGDSNIAGAYIGESDVSTMYIGDAKIYEKPAPTPSGYTIQLIAQKEGEFGNGSTIYGYTDNTKTTQVLFVNAGASVVLDQYGGNTITSLSNTASIYLYNPDTEQSGYKIGSSGQKTWINGGTGVTLTFDSDTTLYLITLGKD